MSSDERRYKNFLFYVTNFISDFLQKCKVFHYRKPMGSIPECYTDDYIEKKVKEIRKFSCKTGRFGIRMALG